MDDIKIKDFSNDELLDTYIKIGSFIDFLNKEIEKVDSDE